MAERRMICSRITESDYFLDLPVTAQNLYFHLQMYADDRGFVQNPRTVMRMCGASNGDAQALLNAKFLLSFPDKAVVLIKHWRIHNLIRKDRFHESAYVELLNALFLDENGSYSENTEHSDRPVLSCDNQLTTNCQPTDNQLSTSCHTEDRLGYSKDSLGYSYSQDRSGGVGENPASQLPEWMQTGNANIDSAIAAAAAMRERRNNAEVQE